MPSSLLHSLFGAERKFGESKPIPASVRPLYARWRHANQQMRDAEAAFAAANGRDKAAQLELLHALSKADPDITRNAHVEYGDDGTYRVETAGADAKPKAPQPPAWVAEELAKIERDERNAERDE